MLNAAVVGLGWWGKQIIDCLADSTKIKVTHAVTSDPEKSREFAARHQLQLKSDYPEILAEYTVDAVILTTPHLLHEPQVIVAAGAGKQIFCEKPLALSAASAERMLAACDKRNIILGIGHQRRFEGALEEIRRMLINGQLGSLLHLECNWSHNNFAKPGAPAWRKDPQQAPAGTLTALGVHITDYFQSLAGPVAEVSAKTVHRSPDFPGNDITTVNFSFANGATGYMCNLASTPFYCRISVFGERGWAEARVNANMDVHEPAELITRDSNDRQSTRTFEWKNTVKANLEQWADAIEGHGEYRFSRKQKLHNIQILEAIVRSAQTDVPVKV
jgi:predicted dehydrogenase